jgi:hypothetical protein
MNNRGFFFVPFLFAAAVLALLVVTASQASRHHFRKVVYVVR